MSKRLQNSLAVVIAICMAALFGLAVTNTVVGFPLIYGSILVLSLLFLGWQTYGEYVKLFFNELENTEFRIFPR